MKRFNALIILIAFLFIVSISGIANAITLSERDELNNATPGTSKVGLGTIVRAVTAVGVDFLTTEDTSISVSVEPSGDTGYVRKFTGARKGDGSTLADGNVGQIMTLALTVDGGQDWFVTPDTSSGFRKITFTDEGDVATIRFVDSDVGWVVMGTADVTSGPILTKPAIDSTPPFK